MLLTDRQIEAVYRQILQRIDQVNADYLQKVGEQIKAIGKLNASSMNRLVQMQIYGANVQKIKRELLKHVILL